MRFRLALGIGLAIGYILGTRAGRERYEQIRRAFDALRRSEPAQQIGAEVRGVTSRASQRLEEKAAERVSRISDRLRGRNARQDATAAPLMAPDTPPAPPAQPLTPPETTPRPSR